MLDRYLTPNRPYIDGVPFGGWGLDFSRPEVYLVQEAGLVTSGIHKYKVAWITASGTTKCGDCSASITTVEASAGKVFIPCPLYQWVASTGLLLVPPGIPAGATGWNVYRTEAGGSTYKLVNAAPITTYTGYLDNIADGALGAAEPGSNTSVTLNNPTLLATSVTALTAGSATDYLVAYFLMKYRWTLTNGAANNSAVFVPGTWAYDGTAYKWPYFPSQGGEWTPSAVANSALTIPSYSSDWDAMKALIWAANAFFIDVQINMTHETGGTVAHTVTITPEGGTASVWEAVVANRENVPLMVCQGLLTVLHDPDWY